MIKSSQRRHYGKTLKKLKEITKPPQISQNSIKEKSQTTQVNVQMGSSRNSCRIQILVTPALKSPCPETFLQT